jgi:hypothetical protein
MRYGPALDALLREVELVLNHGIDRAKAHHKLQEAETLLDRVAVGDGETMRPPWTQFEEKLAELDSLAQQLAATDAARARQYRDGIPGLRAAGRKAYDAGEQLDWTTVNEALNRQIAAIEKELNPGRGGGRDLPPVPVLQMMLQVELQGIVDAVRQLNQATGGEGAVEARGLIAEAEAISAQIQSVSAHDAAGGERIVAIYHSKIQPLRARAERWTQQLRAGDKGTIILRLPGASL